MNRKRPVNRYVARHSRTNGRSQPSPYIGRHALPAARPARSGDWLGRFLVVVLFLFGPLLPLIGAVTGRGSRRPASV
jgi:hypothetical protein